MSFGNEKFKGTLNRDRLFTVSTSYNHSTETRSKADRDIAAALKFSLCLKLKFNISSSYIIRARAPRFASQRTTFVQLCVRDSKNFHLVSLIYETLLYECIGGLTVES